MNNRKNARVARRIRPGRRSGVVRKAVHGSGGGAGAPDFDGRPEGRRKGRRPGGAAAAGSSGETTAGWPIAAARSTSLMGRVGPVVAGPAVAGLVAGGSAGGRCAGTAGGG